jgi:hypothetical protein
MNGFESLEHQYLGDQISLRFYTSNPAKLLHLPNGLALTYGQIVMMSGDLFGDPKHPISSCNAEKRKECFNLQFDALAGGQDKKDCQNPRTQAQNLVHYYKTIEQLLTDWRNKGRSDPDFYKEYGPTVNKKLNRLTCGGSLITDYIPFGNYLNLSANNFDHFLPDSLVAYKAGHQAALETALLGYQQKIMGHSADAGQLLELAYAQNAFANHFLTDSFASGHMRVPKRGLYGQVRLPAILNLLIANLMHDEDNRQGLNVVNTEGTSWIAYGDNYLFQKDAELHRIIVLQSMQRSADSIYDTFESGNIPKDFSELKLVPLVEKIEQLNQTSPLFKLQNGVVLKRKDNHDPYNYEWTDHWSGLIMLLDF